jgi:hypothetical protein
MNNTNKTLAALLVLQALLIGATWWPRSNTGFEARELLGLAASEITSIKITGRTTTNADNDANSVKLTKSDGGWTLSSLANYPADPIKVEKLLEKIATISVRSPIGSTEASHRAFEVATDQFTRHVEIVSAAGQVDLYLGAGSGSSMNVRRADETEVYVTRGTTAWSIADSPNRYFDSSYLKVDLADITSFSIQNPDASFQATRENGSWTATELPEGMALDTRKLDSLARSLLSVRLAEPVGTSTEAAYGLAQGSRVEWTVSEDNQTAAGGYTIGSLNDGKHYVKADDQDFVVLVNESGVNKALKDFDFFVEAAPEELPAE